MRIGVNGRFLAARRTGVQRWACEVIGRLVQRADVTLFLPRDAQQPHAWNAPAVTGRLRGYAWEQLELPRHAARNCDVLFSPANAAPLRMPRQVVMLHDVFPLTHPAWFSWPFAAWHGLALRRIAHEAALILTSSHAMAASISDETGVSQDAIVVAPQGVAPFDSPAPRADVERVCARHGIHGPYVLALGAGDRRKNVPFAADVVQRYHRVHGAAPALVVAGSPSARVHGRGTGADFDAIRTGHVSDEELRALYTGADALLYPSLAEGFGRPPLEALCCGTPALVADYAAAAEVLRDSPAVRLPLDAPAWVDALHRVRRAARPSAALRATLAARWSWDATADMVLDACRAAVERGDRRVHTRSTGDRTVRQAG